MDIWTPCIVLEILHRDPEWHDFNTPVLSGHFQNEKDAVDELIRATKLMAANLIDDPCFIKQESDGCREDPCIQETLYYTDRCITINGYIYHGHV